MRLQDMAHRARAVVLTLCSFRILAADSSSTEPFGLRLVGGASRCQGGLEMTPRGRNWTTVDPSYFNLQFVNRVCAELGCGSAVSVRGKRGSVRETSIIIPDCEETSLSDCFKMNAPSNSSVELKCSDSVRLRGPRLCSGSLELHQNQSWTPVCEEDFDLQDAEVVCRELGCGAPSLLQGALYGEVRALGQTFLCEGHESALMDCPRSSSGNTCSSGTAVELTCSDPDDVRLVGGASHCDGAVQVKHLHQWRDVWMFDWDLRTAAAVCRRLDCGSVVSAEGRRASDRSAWRLSSSCVRSTSSLRECVRADGSSSSFLLSLICSDSVRLRGPRLCSGSLELHQNQSWTPVCEGGFDLRDAEVVCRELGCGAPSLLQGVLYGEVQALGQTFLCEGHESALMDCPRSSSGNTCSSGTAVELTCSEPVRLVEGASRCAGAVELRHRGDWRPVGVFGPWNLGATAAVCRDLGCGSAVSGEQRDGFPWRPVWEVRPDCVKKSALRDCVWDGDHSDTRSLEVVCLDSVRLRGPRLCSGSLEFHQNQSWTPVCEGDFDLQDAEVVCRELGCGAPSLLQGALYGEVQALGQTFLCEGHESALMDCPRSSSGNTCSSGTAVELTCSEPVRLVGGASRCAGAVELRLRGDWRPVDVSQDWDLEATAAVCRDLDCGSAVSEEKKGGFPKRPVWWVTADCVKKSALRDCAVVGDYSLTWGLEVVCSDFLTRPTISLSVSADGVSEAQPQGLRVLLGSDFSVRCSVEPQYPGGSFQLLSPTVDPAQSHTLPAVNHSAHFLFSDAGSAHKGGYTCVYHLHVFSHNFSSQSHTLYLTFQATRGHQRRQQRPLPEDCSRRRSTSGLVQGRFSVCVLLWTCVLVDLSCSNSKFASRRVRSKSLDVFLLRLFYWGCIRGDLCVLGQVEVSECILHCAWIAAWITDTRRSAPSLFSAH